MRDIDYLRRWMEENWHVPQRFQNANYESLHPNQLAVRLSRGGGLLTGTKGNGKTYRAAVWLNVLGAGRIWLHQGDIVTCASDQDWTEIYDHWAWKRYVVIDDFDPTFLTQHRGEILFSLVNTRYANGLSTLVTSNLAPSEIVKIDRHWAALVDRLAESGLYRLEGKSLRTVV